MWDANQYLKFAQERARPFLDLLAQVPCEHPAAIVDLGCGAGNLTRLLAERWPAACVVGIDTSAEMLAQAQKHALPGRLEFVQADLASWSPPAPVDLLVSNAALQWVPDHERLLTRFAGILARGGVLAVQVPDRFQGPTQAALDDTVADPRWSAHLTGIGLHKDSVRPLDWYVERLHDLGFKVNAWQATYLHVLTGASPVLEWMKGTAVRPLLAALPEALRESFLLALGERFARAYPPRRDKTLFPFPRLFFVGRRETTQE